MTTAITLTAPAKINLALAVGTPIPEGPQRGMHPIASWMTAIDLADRVHIERTDGPSAHTVRWHDATPVDWPIESDLGYRAHRALESVAGPLPVRLEIVKRIPAGGGLGGGSSDAASVLVALNRLFRLNMPRDELARIALTLGSDIPFFLDHVEAPGAAPRPALVTGLGDRVQRLPPIDPAGSAILLIRPPFGCPTGPVYRAFDDHPPATFRDPDVADLARAGALSPHELFNDLAEPAQRVEPRLADLRRSLAGTLGTPVHVSGSGSTLFALVPGDRAEATRDAAADRHPDSVVQLVRPAGRAGQQSA